MKQLIIFSLVLLAACGNQNTSGGFGEGLWQDKIFVQKTFDNSSWEDGIIRARVDGKWQDYELTNLPESFLTWNLNARLTTLAGIMSGEMPGLDGPHNAMVATSGFQREDSRFSLNNAVKGTGFLPRKERLPEVIELLKSTFEEDYARKIEVLQSLYEQGDSLFDLSKQISLELYSNPERGTQTFLNQMVNPVSVIVFLDIPTFKLKTINYLLHPENPDLTEYERNIVEYVNLVHSYFHGHFDRDFITVVYNVIEVYNSSPGNENGRGTRIE